MKNILSIIEKSFQRFPNKIAVADEQNSLSYQELSVEAKQIGSCLLRLKQRNQPVAVYLDKTPYCVAAMLGILYSGNFYVVLDTAMPAERVKRIFETLKPVAVITNQLHRDTTTTFCQDIEVILYEDCQMKEINQNGLDEIRKTMVDTDPAYALYTSGSTGRPKGAIVSHKALISYSSWFIREFSIQEDTIFGSQTPLPIMSSTKTSILCALTYSFIPQNRANGDEYHTYLVLDSCKKGITNKSILAYCFIKAISPLINYDDEPSVSTGIVTQLPSSHLSIHRVLTKLYYEVSASWRELLPATALIFL